ncbi:MAG: protein kinase [Steroidobacterales bacterium]
MSVSAELDEAGVDEADDALRALVSSILSGHYKEELYLWHVSALSRDEPESAARLLELIERYHRIGRMPAPQYQMLKSTIKQTMGTKQRADEFEDEDAYSYEDDVDSEESVTRELAPARVPRPDQPAPRPRASGIPGQSAQPAVASKSAPKSSSAETAAAASPGKPEVPLAPPPAARRPDAADAPARRSEAAEAAHTTIGIGTVLRDRYELLQLIGRGGMASVYKARDRYRTSLGVADCLVAIKIVQPHPSRPGSLDALGREFHNAQRLSHPNVVNVYDIDREGDASFYTMELLEGERLSQLLNRAGGRLPRRYAMAIIRDIGAAIAHAHSRGVVHADLKPHNIMITRDGQVRVLDFGSGIVRPGEPWIAELSPGGDYRQATPAYASCEQLQGWCADPRDDIYALACLAYQLLAGRHPFDLRSSLVARGRRLRPRRPTGMHGDSWRALRRGLAWSREQRNMTMEKWLEQLGAANSPEILPPLARLAAAPPPRQWPQRAAAAAVVLFSLSLAGFAIERQADVDWHQALAGVQSTWDDAWRELSGNPSAATKALPAQPAAPAPTLSVMPAAAADPVKPAALSGARAHGARTSSPIGAPAAIAFTDNANAPAAVHGAPRVEFAAANYDVALGEPAAHIVVRRLGSTDGDVSFTWWTEAASAQPDVDYAPLGRRIERIPSGTDKITVYVPIISNPLRSRSNQFYVALSNPPGSSSAPSARASVTIDR